MAYVLNIEINNDTTQRTYICKKCSFKLINIPMYKIFGFTMIYLFFFMTAIAQPLSFGLSYGKNFTHAYTLMTAAFSKEIESHAIPKDEYSLLLRYNVYDKNWLSIEPRLIERKTSYFSYIGSPTSNGVYYLKNYELLLTYSQFLFSIKNKLSFNLFLLTGYSHLVDYQLWGGFLGKESYFDPRKTDGILIGYGLNLSYLLYNDRIRFFVRGSLSHLSIENLYNIDCSLGILYNLKRKETGK